MTQIPALTQFDRINSFKKTRSNQKLKKINNFNFSHVSIAETVRVQTQNLRPFRNKLNQQLFL